MSVNVSVRRLLNVSLHIWSGTAAGMSRVQLVVKRQDLWMDGE